LAVLIAVNRLLRIDFDLTAGPETFLRQSLEGLKRRLAKFKSTDIPTFGAPTGLIINFASDRAVQFDLNGNPVMIHQRAYRPGKDRFSIGGWPLTESELAAAFGEIRFR
jgi:hypothetical protein